uniref:Uncharacterized protein n=1 Tax=Rhipicephalus zambeziensis TaxID=60191 RepID=A0A224Y7B2_9ACAR
MGISKSNKHNSTPSDEKVTLPKDEGKSLVFAFTLGTEVNKCTDDCECHAGTIPHSEIQVSHSFHIQGIHSSSTHQEESSNTLPQKKMDQSFLNPC